MLSRLLVRVSAGGEWLGGGIVEDLVSADERAEFRRQKKVSNPQAVGMEDVLVVGSQRALRCSLVACAENVGYGRLTARFSCLRICVCACICAPLLCQKLVHVFTGGKYCPDAIVKVRQQASDGAMTGDQVKWIKPSHALGKSIFVPVKLLTQELKLGERVPVKVLDALVQSAKEPAVGSDATVASERAVLKGISASLTKRRKRKVADDGASSPSSGDGSTSPLSSSSNSLVGSDSDGSAHKKPRNVNVLIGDMSLTDNGKICIACTCSGVIE